MKVSSVPSNVISSPVLDKSSSLLELIVLYCRSYFGAGISGFGGTPYNFSLRFLISFFLFIAFVHSLHSERGTTFPDSYFLVNAFQIHPLIRHQLESQCKGAIMDGLNLTIIKGLKFKLPPIKLQRKFVEFYNQVDKSKVAVQRALDETQILFDSLMQKYFG